jgi:hypothetical protein
MAVSAWCGSSASCIAYIPFAAFGGLLFAPAAIIVAVLLVGIVWGIFRVRLGILVVVALSAFMSALGFAIGSLPGIRGEGP